MFTVLYADDEPINCSIFKLNFKKSFQVLTAESGMEALKILEENPQVDVIVSDMKMPEMNGLEFIHIAKTMRKDIPCFILSGYDLSEIVLKAIQDGVVVKYFQKPMEKSIVQEEINKILT